MNISVAIDAALEKAVAAGAKPFRILLTETEIAELRDGGLLESPAGAIQASGAYKSVNVF